jgi:hypothetical protein
MLLSELLRAANIALNEGSPMNTLPERFEQGKRVATKGIPADANSRTAGSGDAPWKNGCELIAGENEVSEREG